MKFRFNLIENILQRLANRIYRNHPAMVERLKPIIGKSFFINITNLPLNVFFEICSDSIMVRVVPFSKTLEADLHISARLNVLISIFEGDEDGDALFFSRKLQVKGNTAPLVRLRNAIDSEDINIVDEICDSFGVLSTPMKKVISFAGDNIKRYVY